MTPSVAISVPATEPNVTYTLSGLTLRNNLDTLTLNTSGSAVALNDTVAFTEAQPSVTTPEPSTIALALSGLGVSGLALVRRRLRAEKLTN